MARNDQARWAPSGSEDAPDRWRGAPRAGEPPFEAQGRWAFGVPSSHELHCGPRCMRPSALFVITGSAWQSRASGEDEPSRLGLGWVCTWRRVSAAPVQEEQRLRFRPLMQISWPCRDGH